MVDTEQRDSRGQEGSGGGVVLELYILWTFRMDEEVLSWDGVGKLVEGPTLIPSVKDLSLPENMGVLPSCPVTHSRFTHPLTYPSSH